MDLEKRKQQLLAELYNTQQVISHEQKKEQQLIGAIAIIDELLAAQSQQKTRALAPWLHRITRCFLATQSMRIFPHGSTTYHEPA